MENINKPSGNIRFWLLAIGLVTMMIISQSCTQTQHLCPAYGTSWDRTQAGR